ncbi:Wzz/FepE/Etk N-terminal domain-containing protein [Larkinella humicola]|uniref:Lipopolysaccharide biosynthesis protein n=1 Tax=Larkinella humicola TaxID=2607654 RepID=A0A5N1JFE6_9BACT|nr:Wzz/FepE/Etk N-terminal domain-containing protein [Larkinella humicola]KAA9349459.1 lipopolysaccharide biosynthesis protein [Larkinella humicola]
MKGEAIIPTANHVVAQPVRESYWLGLSPGRLVKLLWKRRVRLLLITAFFSITGIIVSFLQRPEYISEARIMPEISQGSGDLIKRLATVAGFAGLELGETGSVDAVRPDLYPKVLQSTPFVLALMNKRVPTQDGGQTSVAAMLSETDSWFEKKWFSFDKKADNFRANVSPHTIRLTQDQQDLLEDIQQRVSAQMDTRSGVITVSAQMPDPVAVAAVTQITLDYLTRYVSNYRTEKVRRDLEFYTNRVKEAKRRFERAQYSMFHYTDQHKYMVVQTATMEKQRIEAELTIAQAVYTELAKQFEQAKIKVQEQTPVFKVLEPATIPLKRSSPRRTNLVLLFTLTGLVLGGLSCTAVDLDAWGHLRRSLSD